MDRIDSATIDRLPLVRIDAVTFFKRDELCTDLICCEVEVDGLTWFFHEEADGWDLLVKHLERLPDFRADWYGASRSRPSRGARPSLREAGEQAARMTGCLPIMPNSFQHPG